MFMYITNTCLHTFVSECGLVVIGEVGQRTASSISLGVTLVFIC